ncbi:MAG: Uma2 family endonuclease [Leptolyngbyaceae cyanobacterium SM1_1_3]|nr:Uma2 family endonuclease [Leptolyngbyaceae cyanobacterium SM1_1_3]NJN04842.1 Uma2 family endonuclease [Leptolyngbyaceae cyanobacterium RM1_1_2]NJO08765.1 Uma2 family endonuclease [Leptolyngbyaceae cyanobacterium SL_1_1]
MVQISTKPLTLEEFLQMPGTEPASEYIDGLIIQKPMPQGENSVVQTELAPAINLVVKPKQIARAFTELRCTFGGRSTVPDIAVFLWDRIPRRENGGIANVFSVAPDWTIEILSPDQSQTKVTKNILHCLKYGTQMGWLIDPEERSVFVYLPDQPTTVYDEPRTRLSVPEFAKDFNLTVEGLFSWLME